MVDILFCWRNGKRRGYWLKYTPGFFLTNSGNHPLFSLQNHAPGGHPGGNINSFLVEVLMVSFARLKRPASKAGRVRWQRGMVLCLVAAGMSLLMVGCGPQQQQSHPGHSTYRGYSGLSPAGQAAVDGLRSDAAYRRGLYYRPPDYRPPDPPPASSSPWLPAAAAAQPSRARPDPPPPIVEPAPQPGPSSSGSDRCGWWRLRQLWC